MPHFLSSFFKKNLACAFSDAHTSLLGVYHNSLKYNKIQQKYDPLKNIVSNNSLGQAKMLTYYV